MTDFGPDREPEQPLYGAGAQFAASPRVHHRQRTRVCTRKRPPSHHRRADGPDGHLPHPTRLRRICFGHRHCGVFLHGADSNHPTADHAAAHHEERARKPSWCSCPRFEAREGCFPIIVSILCILLLPFRRPADRHAHAGQPLPRVRRCGASLRYPAERADQHRDHLPRRPPSARPRRRIRSSAPRR